MEEDSLGEEAQVMEVVLLVVVEDVEGVNSFLTSLYKLSLSYYNYDK
jgi:hypothetical protein